MTTELNELLDLEGIDDEAETINLSRGSITGWTEFALYLSFHRCILLARPLIGTKAQDDNFYSFF